MAVWCIIFNAKFKSCLSKTFDPTSINEAQMNGILLLYPFHGNKMYIELCLSSALIICTPFSCRDNTFRCILGKASFLGFHLTEFLFKMYFVFHVRFHVTIIYLFCHNSFRNRPVDQFIFFYILWRMKRSLSFTFDSNFFKCTFQNSLWYVPFKRSMYTSRPT